MTDIQMLTVALASVPTMITVLIGILISNARLTDLNSRMDRRFEDMRNHLDHRLDDMKAMWQSELQRVEEVLDARLKHLEERA